MMLALAAVLTATVVTAEATTPSAGSHGAVAGAVTLTDARGETFEAPGVELVLACATTPDEPRTAASDEHGIFRFADVRAGRCALSADLQGFGKVTTDVVVGAAETLKVEIHLDVAPVAIGVRVVGESTCSWHRRRFN
jgi:hypothetical protein